MMAKTPDNRQVFTCPTCNGKTYNMVSRQVKRGKEYVTEQVKEDCGQCDASGQIVSGPA
ncbi:hypothetical protein [Amycolatopsis antarctica]|uniref:hypothetical protein n=1 Tax=Amycolatopsis antarctica TaxID=1854586 RepID=UPI0013FD2669|nr:hypothetical protein [Amycolatopsis antarctica]